MAGGRLTRRAPPFRLLIATLLVAGCLPSLGCSRSDVSRFNPLKRFSDLDEDAERELGMEFDRKLETKVDVIHDPIVAGFITDLGQAIVREIEPQPFLYRFRVIRDGSLNAFAVPGGYVYLHSGTLLEATSIDELAGVMGHEVAHVKGHHYARMRKQTQIPDLLTGLAGIGVAVATGEPGALTATQAVNVALKLKYSREFEREADEFGAIFMTRAGYDPNGIARFFERILETEKRRPHSIPPYLYSHPDVRERISAVEIRAESLRPTRPPSPDLTEALHAAQARLAQLVVERRKALLSEIPPTSVARSEAFVAEARRLADAGDPDRALLVLARGARLEPNDPRIAFETGVILAEEGRYEEAIATYRRTVALDPSRAQVFYKLGVAYRETGDRQRAVYAFEQARRRAGEKSQLRKRTDWEIEKLTFPVVREAGFGPSPGVAGSFRSGDRTLEWWASLNPRYASYAERIVVRWTDPEGAIVQEAPARGGGQYLTSRYESAGATSGTWKVEMWLPGDLLDRRSLEIP